MSRFSRLTNLARKVLDTPPSSGASADGIKTDWQGILRQAKGTLAGDDKPKPHGDPTAGPRPEAAIDSAAETSSTSQVDENDRAAIARYDYLMDTADPRQIELVHREAFDRLSPSQREQIHQTMRKELPPHEHPRSPETNELARTAARIEAGHPGRLRGLLALAGSKTSHSGPGSAAGVTLGGAAVAAGLAASGLLTAVATGAIVSAPSRANCLAANIGVDFDTLASGINLDGLTGGVEELTGSVEGLTAGASEGISKLGGQLSEFGSAITLPGLDDLLGR